MKCRPKTQRGLIRWSLGLILLTLAVSAIAQRPDARGGRRGGERQNGYAERGERGRNSDGPSEQVVANGYVFVDGIFVAAPYELRQQDSQVLINNRAFELSSFVDAENEGRRRNGNPDNGGRRAFRTVIECLEGGGAIVLFSGTPVEMFYGNSSYDLLNVLIKDDARTAFLAGEQEWLPARVEHQSWIAWISEFDCPPELQDRATEMLQKIERTMTENEAHISAIRTLEASGYPLTVVGMLLVVLSVGHLLSFHPTPDGEGKPEPSPQTLKAVRKSLMLVAALSALDLIWTILVSQTGSMRELNPLGSALIKDPQSLIILKVVATSVAVGILLTLQRHRIAQQGSWWGCLICTLLMVRWLTFNSMFIS
ncbi:MAG: DUF5658 family protein [Fuerstiella sp.]|nr:hypothetical protein [Fuerstiella sp.]